MKTRITTPAPDTLRLEIEAPWETVESDYNDACDACRHAALPGFRPGHAPLSLIRQKYAREIRAEAARRSAARLTRDALRAENIRTIGPITITDATLAPGAAFTCAADLTRRPALALPDYRAYVPAAPHTDIDGRCDEISAWLIANTTCEISDHLVRQTTLLNNTGDDLRPGTDAWREAAQNTLLLLITKEIAEHEGISIDERQFTARLAELAAEAGIPRETYIASLQTNGALHTLRDYFLTETVLDYLATRTQAVGN